MRMLMSLCQKSTHTLVFEWAINDHATPIRDLPFSSWPEVMPASIKFGASMHYGR